MSVEQANNWDAIVIGGGAAGLFCAGVAGQLGQKVLVWTMQKFWVKKSGSAVVADVISRT